MPSATLSDALPPALRYVIPGVVLRPPADGGSRPQWWQFSLELVPGWPQLLATCCLAGLYRDWAALALAVALWGVLVAEVRSNSFDAQLASLALAAVSKSGAGPATTTADRLYLVYCRLSVQSTTPASLRSPHSGTVATVRRCIPYPEL
jgi:hypothetical protein